MLTLADKAGAVCLASPLGLWGKGQDWGGASWRLVPTGQVRSRISLTAPCLCDGLKACPAPVKAVKSFLLAVGLRQDSSYCRANILLVRAPPVLLEAGMKSAFTRG